MQGHASTPLHVFCVKSGDKYPADYANRLSRMVRRNLSRPHSFHCLTDAPHGLDPEIIVQPLPSPDLGGCWNKLRLFSPDLTDAGSTILYLDLDVVLVGSIDALVDCLPGADFVGQPDWNRPWFPQFNSSVMRWRCGSHPEVLDAFDDELAAGRLVRRTEWDGTTKARDKTVYWRGWRRFGSDQEWISARLRPRQPPRQRAFPSGWILSYKRHARQSLPADAKILVFHGSPKPHEVDDRHVRDHWH
jgi:hypothetical protein